MLMKIVESQGQVNVHPKMWFQAFSVQAKHEVEGSDSRWVLSVLGHRDYSPCVTDEEAQGPLV